VLPPFELGIDELGRRVVPLASLHYVLEQALQVEPAPSLELLLEAVEAAEAVPLPGVTPLRADQLGMPRGIPGLELVEPVVEEGFGLVHPGAVEG
jgi:hypothetical protein